VTELAQPSTRQSKDWPQFVMFAAVMAVGVVLMLAVVLLAA
jgi:hypothetical protein